MGYRRVIVFLLVLCLLLTAAALPLAASSVDTAYEISEAESSRDYYLALLADARADQEALEYESFAAENELAWLQERSTEQQEVCALALEQKNHALFVMAQTASDYLAAVDRLEKKKTQYAERLQVMFDHSGRSLLETFLEAESLQSFFTTLEFMAMIADADEQMIEELIEAREEADRCRDDAESAAVEMQKLVEEADQLLLEIQSEEELQGVRLAELRERLSAAESEAALWTYESQRIADDIASLTDLYQEQLAAEEQAEAERQAAQAVVSTPVYSGGYGFAWPLPGHYYITSYYGYRDIFGGTSFHAGIDIAADYGTPIVAAASGVVLMAEWYSTAGNFVAISHGNGYVTCYAHLNDYNVWAGQSVSMGDVIGYVGSTGRSTGPHLHYEIRDASGEWLGTTLNPLSFY